MSVCQLSCQFTRILRVLRRRLWQPTAIATSGRPFQPGAALLRLWLGLCLSMVYIRTRLRARVCVNAHARTFDFEGLATGCARVRVFMHACSSAYLRECMDVAWYQAKLARSGGRHDHLAHDRCVLARVRACARAWRRTAHRAVLCCVAACCCV